MTRAVISAPAETRIVAASLVLLLHIAVILFLLNVFSPRLVRQVVDSTVTAFSVPAPAPAPSRRAPDKAGAAGRQAVRHPLPPPPRYDLSIKHEVAPQAVSTDAAVTSGTQDTGSGTGADGSGNGAGQGGGNLAEPLVKIAGDINSARDYPREGRELRNGDTVVIALTVGVDGRARACRIQRPSRDGVSDQITCRLAMRRFRFRPRRDAGGNPVEGVYLWQQRWWDPAITN